MIYKQKNRASVRVHFLKLADNRFCESRRRRSYP